VQRLPLHRQPIRGALLGLFLGVFAAVIAGLVIYDRTYVSRIRACVAHQRAAEIEQENSAFCTKLGVSPETTALVACGRAVVDFRQRVEERLVNEAGDL